MAWSYLILEGAILAAMPLWFPPPDPGLLMALYAGVGSFGAAEVLAVGLIGDLISCGPLGLGALGKLLLFFGMRRFSRGLEVAKGPFFVMAAFSGVIAESYLREMVLALAIARPAPNLSWVLGSAAATALLAWPLLRFNDRLFCRWHGSLERAE